jgi:hypothetical protein
MILNSSDSGCRTKGPMPNLGRLTEYVNTMYKCSNCKDFGPVAHIHRTKVHNLPMSFSTSQYLKGIDQREKRWVENGSIR